VNFVNFNLLAMFQLGNKKNRVLLTLVVSLHWARQLLFFWWESWPIPTHICTCWTNIRTKQVYPRGKQI